MPAHHDGRGCDGIRIGGGHLLLLVVMVVGAIDGDRRWRCCHRVAGRGGVVVGWSCLLFYCSGCVRRPLQVARTTLAHLGTRRGGCETELMPPQMSEHGVCRLPLLVVTGDGVRVQMHRHRASSAGCPTQTTRGRGRGRGANWVPTTASTKSPLLTRFHPPIVFYHLNSSPAIPFLWSARCTCACAWPACRVDSETVGAASSTRPFRSARSAHTRTHDARDTRHTSGEVHYHTHAYLA